MRGLTGYAFTHLSNLGDARLRYSVAEDNIRERWTEYNTGIQNWAENRRETNLFYVGVLVVAFVFFFFICITDDIPAERWKTKDGYIRVKYWGERRSVLEHREVAEAALGRRLLASEVVHHRNGRKDDNRLENLCVMNSREHFRYHQWAQNYREREGRWPPRFEEVNRLRGAGGILLVTFVEDEAR